MVPILLLAFWLGARSLDTRPVWRDEIHSIHDAGGDPDAPLTDSLWASLALRNPLHAPLYFYTLNAWGTLTSWHPAILRGLSLMLGLLAVAVTARAASEMFAPWAGIFAAAIMGTSAFYVHYLFEMRVYSLMALMSALDILLYLRIVNARKAPSRWQWLALLMVVTATLYTHYMAVFPLIAIGIYHLLFVRRDRRWWQVIGVFALAGVLFLPWLSVFIRGYQRFELGDDIEQGALTPLQALTAFFKTFGNDILMLPITLMALAATALRHRATRQIVFLALISLAVVMIANVFVVFLDARRLRYFMPLWPLFTLATTLGLVQFRRWPALLPALLALLLGFGVWQSLDNKLTATLAGSEFDYPIHQVAEIVHRALQDGDLVVSMLPDSYREGISTYTDIAHVYYAFYGVPDKIRVVASDDKKRQIVDQTVLLMALKQQQRLWISYSGEPPKTLSHLTDLLRPDFIHCFAITDYPKITINLYVQESQKCPVSPPRP